MSLRRNLAHKAAGFAVLAAVVTTTGALGAGTASATTVTYGSCTGTVPVHMGDQVTISGKAVAEQARLAIKENPGLFTNPDDAFKQMSSIPSIPVGTMPKKAAAQIPGDAIAQAVDKAYENGITDGLGLDKPKSREAIKNKIGGLCTLTAKAVDYKPAPPPSTRPSQPSQAPSSAPASKPSQAPSAPAQPTAPGVGGTAPSPAERYSAGSVPAMRAPAPNQLYGVPSQSAPNPGSRYGVPGYSPQSGQLTPSPDQDPVHQAGRATSLADEKNGDAQRVGVPMLIAVIALAGVSAALVRTWALRKL